ncbi:hypothetical protein ILYODFUR_016409 [Ilyodon furcidens]|uniref:Uncharacterized protein n=1 Tax=Ilyodon furcidens TaxID=33524 RepID=A0ABV0UIT2_9TELE
MIVGTYSPGQDSLSLSQRRRWRSRSSSCKPRSFSPGQDSLSLSQRQRWRSGSSTHECSDTPRTTINQSLRQPLQKSIRAERDPPNAAKAMSTYTQKLRKDAFPMSEKKFQKKVLQLLLEIKDTIHVASSSAGTSYEVKPANTEQKFEALEKRLEDKNEGAELSKHLKRLGGVDAADLVKKSMAATMTNKMMAKMSGKKWEGCLREDSIVQDSMCLKVLLQPGLAAVLNLTISTWPQEGRKVTDRSGSSGRKDLHKVLNGILEHPSSINVGFLAGDYKVGVKPEQRCQAERRLTDGIVQQSFRKSQSLDGVDPDAGSKPRAPTRAWDLNQARRSPEESAALLWIRTRHFGQLTAVLHTSSSSASPPPPHFYFLHLNPGGPLASLSGWYREDYSSSSVLFLVKAKLPEGHSDVLHPGQPPPGGPDHEGGAAPHRHDPGPLLDAGRRDFGR